jgi:hypothetical protein
LHSIPQFILVVEVVQQNLKIEQVDLEATVDSILHNYFLVEEVTKNSMLAFYQMYHQIQMYPEAIIHGLFLVVEVELMHFQMDYNQNSILKLFQAIN